MTLATNIGLINPKLDAETVFTFCASLLDTDENYIYGRNETFRGAIAAAPGQGCPAWLIVDDSTPGYLEVSFDTAYGYTGPNGESCTDLHSWYIREIARWVPEGTVMFWLNEYSGSWYRVNFGEDMEECLLSDFEYAEFGNPNRKLDGQQVKETV